jgi:hypothetical protein
MKKLLAFIFLSSILLFSECKKYPEGPYISLRSKKERIANTWKLSKYLEDGVDLTSTFNSTFTQFAFYTTKDGNYTITRQYYSIITTTESGTWSLSSNKKDFNLNPSSISAGTLPSTSTWQILKLYEKDFWLRSFDSNGKTIEYHLIPQ